MEIDPLELEKLLDANAPVLLLDVRQQWEHDLARIPGSVLIPLHELPARFGELQPQQGQRVVTYCHLGVRSLHAAMFLRAHGIEAVSLHGGIDAWSNQVDPSVPRY